MGMKLYSYFRGLLSEPKVQTRAVSHAQALSMADWTCGSGRRSGPLMTKAFLASAMGLLAYLAAELKKRLITARFLAVLSLDGPTELTRG